MSEAWGNLPAARSEAGFTLVEMLVALLIFGIIATVATALTAGATRSFAATDTALAQLADLGTARSLLAADLGQAAQRPSLGADGRPMPAFTLTESGFVLVRLRPGGVPMIEKVAWGLEEGRLLRQPFQAVDGGAAGEPVAIASGIQGIRLRVATETGWAESWAPSAPEELPRAVEITLVRQDGVAVTLKLPVAA